MVADASIIRKVLALVPQQDPFRFIDEIISLDEEQILGAYRFCEDAFFTAAISPAGLLHRG